MYVWLYHVNMNNIMKYSEYVYDNKLHVSASVLYECLSLKHALHEEHKYNHMNEWWKDCEQYLMICV